MGRATVLWATVQNEDPLLNLFFQSFSVFSVVSVVMFFVFARRLSLPSSAFSASSAVKCLLCSEALNAPSRTGRGRPGSLGRVISAPVPPFATRASTVPFTRLYESQILASKIQENI